VPSRRVSSAWGDDTSGHVAHDRDGMDALSTLASAHLDWIAPRASHGDTVITLSSAGRS
jgi:hypothetical protein